ncbi:MAG: lysozyme inhibitor LprI family protein [Cyanobacteria bacterium P01_D01_bin.1]
MKTTLVLSCLTPCLLALFACTPPSATQPTTTAEPTQSTPSEAAPRVEVPTNSTDSAGQESALDGYRSNSSTLLIGPFADQPEDCGSFDTQTEMNLCAKRNADMTSEQLEQISIVISDFITAPGKDALFSSQTAWKRFRDLDCGFVSGQYSGGSISSLVYGECANAHNLARIEELKGEEPSALSYAEADALLNQNYQSLRDSLSEPRTTALIDVQLAWIEYRDRNCAYEASYSPTFTGTENQCLARMSETRALDLEQAIEQ